MTFALFVTVFVLALGLVLWPFVRRAVPTLPGGDATFDTGEALRLQQAALYESIRDLEFAYQVGRYTREDYERLRLDYEQQAAAVLQTLHQQQPDLAATPQAPSPHQETVRSGRRWLRPGLVTATVVIAGLGWGYWLSRATSASPDLPGLLTAADAALERGNVSDALQHYRAVLEQEPGNATALTKLGILAQRSGQPAAGLRLIERALQQQPRYLPAWQAKGMMHHDQGDYQQAIAAWETYLRLTSDDDPHRQPMAALIARTKQRAGAARMPAPAPAKTAAAVSGTIRLAIEAASPIPVGATLFIIARTDTGPPLAVKRIVDPQFPLRYTLGENDVMMSGRSFTGPVNVSARLQATGAIGPSQPGDLAGKYPNNPVAVGTSGVDITLERQG